jgi:hypothetical protein
MSASLRKRPQCALPRIDGMCQNLTHTPQQATMQKDALCESDASMGFLSEARHRRARPASQQQKET